MRFIQRVALSLPILCGAWSWAPVAKAQQTPPGPGAGGDVIYWKQATAGPAAGLAVMDQTIKFISAVGPGAAHLVTGAPYSAQSSTETVQTLADGNRIRHENTAAIHRDSQGRTRRDQTLDAIGPLAATSNPPTLSFITDPVAKVQYILDNNAKTARQMPLPDGLPPEGQLPPPPPGASQSIMIFRGPMTAGAAPPPAGPVMAGIGAMQSAQLPAPVTEELGKQTIEGVETTGTRSTVTFPAGTFGNELPIQVVSERWYSDALQEVILSTHNDPRMGKTTYKLSNIDRNEPPQSLFEVPPGYTVIQPPAVSATGFADCVAAGNPVTETMPRECHASDGKTYVEPPPAGAGPRFFNIPLPPR